MFRRIKDFAGEWQQERASTLKILRALTDDSLSQRVGANGRTLGFLAWHITGSLREMLSHTGLRTDGPDVGDAMPARAAEIADAYEGASVSVLEQVTGTWTDDMLEDDVAMYGQTWKRGFVLEVLIRHEAHHRGQMTVLMRQAGIAVPGPYGPGREEWVQMGMEAHA